MDDAGSHPAESVASVGPASAGMSLEPDGLAERVESSSAVAADQAKDNADLDADEDHPTHEDALVASSGSAAAARVAQWWSRTDITLILVVLAGAAYALYLAGLTIDQHNGFGTAGFDIGLYDQGLWLLSRFKAPFVTIMGRNLFGDHSSFILLPLVPFYWFGAGSSFLLAAQSIALGSTGIPVYFTAKRLLHSKWAACALGVAFLLQPALAWTNTENFHPDAFLAPLFATAIAAMVAKRWRWFVFFAVLCTTVKEDSLLVIVPLGLYAWWKYGRTDEPKNRSGIHVAMWSVLWTGASLVILRVLNSVGSLNAWRIPFGGPTGLVKTTFSDPGRVWNYVVKGIDFPGEKSDNRRLWYLWQLFTPTLLLALAAPAEWFLFLFVLGANVISNFYYQYNIQYHYSVVLLPGIFFASMVAITRIRRRLRKGIAVVAVLLSSLWTGYLWGPTPLSAKPTSWVDASAPWVAEGRQLMKQVPDGAVLSVFYGYIPHMGHRVEVYQFPVPWRDSYYALPGDDTATIAHLADRVQWALVRDVDTSPDPSVHDAFLAMTKDFVLVDQAGSSQLYRRRAAGTPPAIQAGAAATPVTEASPTVPTTTTPAATEPPATSPPETTPPASPSLPADDIFGTSTPK